MSYNNILTLEPEFGLEESIGFQTLITPMESGKERRRAKWTYGLRRYRLKLYAYTKTNMDTIWDFFIARKGAYDPFLVLVPTEFEVTTEAIGTGDATRKDWVLDEFPVNTTAGKFTMYVDGTGAAATLSNNFATEFSYVSFSSAPGNNLAITGDYQFYFYMRFTNDRLSRELLAYQLLNAGVELTEVRWDEYRPRAGRTLLIKGSTYDSVSIAESVDAQKFRIISTSNSISINENQSFLFEPLGITLFDTVSIVESATPKIMLYEINVYDSVSIAESAAPDAPA